LNQVRNVLSRAIQVLSTREKRLLCLFLALQLSLTLLDLVGVALIGVIGALSVSGVSLQQPGNRLYEFLEFIGIENLTTQQQVAVIAFFAVVTLVVKTVFNVLVTKKFYAFMARKSVEVTSLLLISMLNQRLIFTSSTSSYQILYSLTTGVNAMLVGVVGGLLVLISDLILTVSLVFGLFVFDPTTAILALLCYVGIGFVLFVRIGQRSQTLTRDVSNSEISSHKLILEVLDSYRETFVSNVQKEYVQRISEIRRTNSENIARLGMMQLMSKYILEVSVIVSGFAFAAVQFVLYDSTTAVATLTLFVAAGMRIAPAILRIQQSGIQMRNSSEIARGTIDWLSLVERESNEVSEIVHAEEEFTPRISLVEVSFSYPKSKNKTVSNVSLQVEPGKFIAIVGPSGSGKSTLIDLILGVLSPDKGIVKISNVPAQVAHRIWPGKTAYVPQDPKIFDSSIIENVALGLEVDQIDLERVGQILNMVGLLKFVMDKPEGLYFQVGENGSNLSGGQRQRLGIARALYTKPLLLVLDEATSALDAESEAVISQMLLNLKTGCTLIVVAHRLSTVQHADLIYYLDEGTIVTSGNLDELRLRIPAFDRQVTLSSVQGKAAQ
jgi:ABC-type multidrug transport system fused ATPase/permease subunit